MGWFLVRRAYPLQQTTITLMAARECFDDGSRTQFQLFFKFGPSPRVNVFGSQSWQWGPGHRFTKIAFLILNRFFSWQKIQLLYVVLVLAAVMVLVHPLIRSPLSDPLILILFLPILLLCFTLLCFPPFPPLFDHIFYPLITPALYSFVLPSCFTPYLIPYFIP